MKELYENEKDLERDPLQVYLKQISKYPLLKRDEEIRLGKQISRIKKTMENLDSKYNNSAISKENYLQKHKIILEEYNKFRDCMINANLRLVVSVAKQFQYRGLSLLDLINEGNIGLIEAVERYDYTRNCKFSTYGIWWIRQSINKAISDKGRCIRIPVHVANTMRKYYSASKYLSQNLGRSPSGDEIGEMFNIPGKKIDLFMTYGGDIVSLDSTIDEGNSTSLSDMITSDAYEAPFDNAFYHSLQNILDTSMNSLSAREKYIIKLRYGIGGEGPLTLEEIGRKIGVTRERVRQIQNRSIEKLKSVTMIRDLKGVV